MAKASVGIYLTGGLGFAGLVYVGGIYTMNLNMQQIGIVIGILIIVSGIFLKFAKVLK